MPVPILNGRVRPRVGVLTTMLHEVLTEAIASFFFVMRGHGDGEPFGIFREKSGGAIAFYRQGGAGMCRH